jgi:protein-tyrosine phosphatase
LNELYPGENKEVPDPYYGGELGFEKVYQMLEEACNLIIAKS